MKLLIAGDYCPQNRVIKLLEDRMYNTLFSDIKNIINGVDYSIVNIECPVYDGNVGAITKCGPNLKCSCEAMEAIKWAGFNCVTLANNHFYDYGENGIISTLDACSKIGLDYVGGGHNIKEASSVLYKNFFDKRIAIINCCEHEFSIASYEKGGANPINPVQQYYDIKNARENSDYVVLIVHGGYEHYQLPSPRMQELYRFYIDVGADVVINHHQHCYSGFEYYKNRPIVYGLGNFCFDSSYRNSKWNYGYLCIVDIDKDFELELVPYKQCTEEPGVEILSDTKTFDTEIAKLNSIIEDQDMLEKEFYNYMEVSSNLYFPLIIPMGRILRFFVARGFPLLYSKKYISRLYNYITCESHIDKLRFDISKRLNNLL